MGAGTGLGLELELMMRLMSELVVEMWRLELVLGRMLVLGLELE